MAVKGNRKGRKKTQSSGTLFKAVVQAFLIFGSEMCVMTPRMDRTLGGFHHKVAHQITGNQPCWIQYGSW